MNTVTCLGSVHVSNLAVAASHVKHYINCCSVGVVIVNNVIKTAGIYVNAELDTYHVSWFGDTHSKTSRLGGCDTRFYNHAPAPRPHPSTFIVGV